MTDAQAGTGREYNAHFGLVDYSLNPKPSYTALKNLITILGDAGSAFTPVPVSYSVSGSADVKSLLLQKRNGSYYLAVWRNVAMFSAATKSEVVPASANIAISFAGPKNISVYYPTVSDAPASSHANTTSLTLPLRGEVAILKF